MFFIILLPVYNLRIVFLAITVLRFHFFVIEIYLLLRLEHMHFLFVAVINGNFSSHVFSRELGNTYKLNLTNLFVLEDDRIPMCLLLSCKNIMCISNKCRYINKSSSNIITSEEVFILKVNNQKVCIVVLWYNLLSLILKFDTELKCFKMFEIDFFSTIFVNLTFILIKCLAT
jgi:hypothetical protein